jgi:hypothetical protein
MLVILRVCVWCYPISAHRLVHPDSPVRRPSDSTGLRELLREGIESKYSGAPFAAVQVARFGLSGHQGAAPGPAAFPTFLGDAEPNGADGLPRVFPSKRLGDLTMKYKFVLIQRTRYNIDCDCLHNRGRVALQTLTHEIIHIGAFLENVSRPMEDVDERLIRCERGTVQSWWWKVRRFGTIHTEHTYKWFSMMKS